MHGADRNAGRIVQAQVDVAITGDSDVGAATFGVIQEEDPRPLASTYASFGEEGAPTGG